MVDLTRGERASHGTPEERAREAEAAAAVMGLAYCENLGIADTEIDPTSQRQLVKVVEVIRRRRPELVLAPWLEGGGPKAAGSLAGMTMEEIERRAIEETLAAQGGNREAAARSLGISSRTLRDKLKTGQGQGQG